VDSDLGLNDESDVSRNDDDSEIGNASEIDHVLKYDLDSGIVSNGEDSGIGSVSEIPIFLFSSSAF